MNSTEHNSSVTNTGGGGSLDSSGVNQQQSSTTQIEPSTSNQINTTPNQVVSSSGSAASTPATSFSSQVARVGFARRFLLNRSKTSGLLFGSSSLADQNRPHSRTVQELFRGEMSVRRPRGSFRNSLHRFGSAEATLRRPVRHHAWAFKDGEWYIAYGEFIFILFLIALNYFSFLNLHFLMKPNLTTNNNL